MKRIPILVIVLLSFFMTECTNGNHSFESASPVPSPFSQSTFTPTPLPIPSQVSSLSPTPALQMNLPEWVRDSKTQILLLPTGTFQNGYENLTLVNALTSERFDIPLLPSSGDYFWMPDGSQFGVLSWAGSQITLVSTKDGNMTTLSVPEDMIGFAARPGFKGPPDSVQASSSDLKDPGFLLVPSWRQLSPDGKRFIFQETYDPTYTSVFEISTRQTVTVTDPTDGYFDLSSEWSPDSRYLAVAQADQEPGMFYSFEVPPTFRLRVYDVDSQQMIASYKNVTFPHWSPDGLKFLYQEWHEWFGESVPCIFDSLSGETKCYYEVLGRHKKSSTIQTTFSSIQWSPDQTMIGYIYSNVDENPYDEYGGFCVITLDTNDTRCMLEEFEVDGQKIIDYSWSPDSNFISFAYDTACPYCDYSDHSQSAIANVKTGEYFTIGDNINVFQLGLWRPPINPESGTQSY